MLRCTALFRRKKKRRNNSAEPNAVNIAAAAFSYPKLRTLRTKQTTEPQTQDSHPHLLLFFSLHLLLLLLLRYCDPFLDFSAPFRFQPYRSAPSINEGCERITLRRGAFYHRMDGGEPQKDYYKVLEVDYDATDEAIRLNYRKLALKWHPDKHKGNSDVTAKFQEINEAYKVLSDPAKRLDYDISGSYEINRYSLREYLTRFKGMILTCNGLGINHASSWRDRAVDGRRAK